MLTKLFSLVTQTVCEACATPGHEKRFCPFIRMYKKGFKISKEAEDAWKKAITDGKIKKLDEQQRKDMATHEEKSKKTKEINEIKYRFKRKAHSIKYS